MLEESRPMLEIVTSLLVRELCISKKSGHFGSFFLSNDYTMTEKSYEILRLGMSLHFSTENHMQCLKSSQVSWLTSGNASNVGRLRNDPKEVIF